MPAEDGMHLPPRISTALPRKLREAGNSFILSRKWEFPAPGLLKSDATEELVLLDLRRWLSDCEGFH